MKEFIENHPAIIVLVACVTCVSATYGVLTFLYDREFRLSKLEHEKKISELTEQIASIDRGIAVDGLRRFNVATSLVDQDKMLQLSGDYESLEPDLVAVKVPTLEEWKFEKLSEASMYELELSDLCNENISIKLTDKDGLSTEGRSVFAWHKRERSSVFFGLGEHVSSEFECNYLLSFPALYTFVIDKEWIDDKVKFFTVLQELDPSEKDLEAKIKEFKQNPERLLLDSDAASAHLNADNPFFGELTGPFLVNKLYEVLMLLTIQPEITGRIMTIEKRINTLYVHFRYTVPVSLTKDALDERKTVIVDDEYFVMSTGDRAVVINIKLPTYKNHGDNVAWTQGWLSGLRVYAPFLDKVGGAVSD